MKPNRRIRVWGLFFAVFAIAVFLAAGTPVSGQETTANVTGIVTDASGSPLAGATVTATDQDRGTSWTSQTDSAGLYNLTRVPVGNYRLKVEAKGFQTAVRAVFTLVLDQTARIDVRMEVGSISQTIEVTSEAPLLQTQSTEVSTLVDSSAAEAIPLAGRNYIELTLLAPGVTHVDPDSLRQPQNMLNSGRPYINGNREQADEFLLDGQLNDESKNNEVAYTPSIDAIQEFNVITQNASSEFGNYQGGIISASIKSGTNQFHGDVFEFFRNDALDANNASAGWTKGVTGFENPLLTPGFSSSGVEAKPELRYNMFGGTIGGPIIKNKLFFFADYQGQRLLNAGLTGTQLLTTSARAGDFGQLCTDFGGSFGGSGVCSGGTGTTQLMFPAGSGSSGPIPFNNLAEAGFTPSAFATNLFASKYYPAPQIDSLNGNNDFFNSGNQLNDDQGDLRMDYKVSEKDGFFGRWSQASLNNPLFTDLPFALDGAGESVTEPLRNAVAGWTHAFSPNILNEFRIGFSAIRFSQNQTPTSGLGNISEQLGITGANYQAPGLIEIDAGGSGAGASASLGLRNLVQIFHTTEGQLEDNLIITRGRHTFKLGGQFVRERQDYIYPGNNGALGYLTINDLTGSTLSDLWLGNVQGGFRDTGGSSTLDQLRGNIYGVFVQDDWRITPTLTLNLGMRFEDHTPLYELHDRVVNFNLYTGAIETPQNGNTNALYDNYLGVGDWQPRVGIAWSPAFWGGRNVIRAGYAVSSYMEGGGSNEQLTQNQPYGIVQQTFPTGEVTSGFGAPNFCTSIDFACYAGQRIRIFDQHFRPSEVQQWNLTIQHQFNNTLTLQAGYVGQHGTHLLNFEDVAQREGLNAAGGIAQPGQLIVAQNAGPYLGGGSGACAQTPGAVCGTPGSLFAADQTPNNASTGDFVCCGALAGANMSNSNQSYNALQMVLQKRMSNGLQAQVAYTFSKCLSNSPGYFGTGWASTNATSSGGQPGWPNIFDPRSDWGPCYYDQKQILSAYSIYQLPVGRGRQFGHDMNPVLNAIVGNWGISGFLTVHSGNAFTLNEFGGWGIGGDTSHTNGIEPYTLSGLPNCNGPIQNENKLVPATPTTAAFIEWFDTSNISDPAPNTFGTCRPGNVRGPAYASVDLNLFKDFTITEHKSLEFRFEALNAFNHPVWTFSGGPAAGSFNTGSGSFGDITGSQGARQVQFALKFYY